MLDAADGVRDTGALGSDDVGAAGALVAGDAARATVGALDSADGARAIVGALDSGVGIRAVAGALALLGAGTADTGVGLAEPLAEVRSPTGSRGPVLF